jgi:hypothetical protein
MKYSKSFLLLVACTLPFMTLIVPGLSIYLVNRNEIAFDLVDVALPLTGLFLVISALLYFLLYFCRRFSTVPGIIAGLVVGLSIAFWVQSQLFVWNFGQFNGKNIAWEKWKINMLIEGITWVAIIAVTLIGFVKRKRNFERAIVMSIYFLGLASVFISILHAEKKIEYKVADSEVKGIFTFHPEKNVLIILLDDFQSDYFDFIVKNYPREVKELDGFTFYRNTISRFPTTKASLPSIINGTLYRNEKPYYDFVLASDDHFNLIHAYKNRSYRTCFVGQLQGVYPDVISMENLAYRLSDSYFYPTLEYLDYDAFRALPIFLKPLIFNKGNWFFTFLTRTKYPPEDHGTDVRFLEMLEKRASVDSNSKGTFKFMHFYIPHAPFRVNEQLQFDPNLSGEKGYLKQTRGAVNLASRILKTLKRIGIYDHTEIIIMADHGTGCLSAINRTSYYDALNLIPPCVQSSSLALLLYKPANSRGKLLTSDVPLELTDLPCILGLPVNDSVCREYKMALSGAKRLRTFYYYEWQHEYWGNNFLPPITQYIVSGPSYDPDSYSPGKFIYTEKGVQTVPPPSSSFSSALYTLGKSITFSTAGNGEADPYIRAGWSTPDPYQRWSDGPYAGLSFHLNKAPHKDLSLRILALGYLAHKRINGQVVSIIANQVPIGRWIVNDSKWYEAVIPNKLIADKSVNLVFTISDPMSPSEVENSKDIRKLGFGVAQLVMEEVK